MPSTHKFGHQKHSSSALSLALPFDTMEPLLVLCLLSPLLVASQDPPLKCQQGTEGSVVSDCGSGLDACVVIKDESTMFGVSFNTKFYDCGKRNSCANAFAITVGDGRYLHHSSACCAEDGCNKDLEWGALPTTWTENGLTCPIGCYAQTVNDCANRPVSCRDAQNSCINATGSSGARKFVLLGCGTSNMCGVKDFELKIAGIPYKMDAISCDTPPTTAKPPTPASATTQKSGVTQKPATSTKTTSKACTHHILGKNSFLLLLPSISSILFMKFLS
ncbi:phospholipase A2 inhibitor gamma subunit B-like [Podarcis muralis]